MATSMYLSAKGSSAFCIGPAALKRSPYDRGEPGALSVCGSSFSVSLASCTTSSSSRAALRLMLARAVLLPTRNDQICAVPVTTAPIAAPIKPSRRRPTSTAGHYAGLEGTAHISGTDLNAKNRTAIQQISTATSPPGTDLIRPLQPRELHQRPPSTVMSLVHTEEVTRRSVLAHHPRGLTWAICADTPCRTYSGQTAVPCSLAYDHA